MTRTRDYAAARAAPDVRLALLVLLGLSAMLRAEDPAPPAAAPPAKPASTLMWTDITDQLSLARHGLSLAAISPDGEALYIGVPDQGLWSSINAGQNWTQVGKDQVGLMPGRLTQLVFDPSAPKSFWISCRGAGGGLLATSDGGVTVTKITSRDDIGSFAVDLTDPKRKTLFFSQFEKSQGVQRSSNGGKIFARVPTKLPDLLPFTAMLALDAKTLLISCDCPGLVKAKGKERATGILRSDDGGTTFATVSKEGSQASPLRLSTGVLLWPIGLDEGILRSPDQGKTWILLEGPIHSCPCDLGKGWLAAVGDRQVQISSNGGKIWQPLGPVLPFAPTGLIFDAKHHALFAWRSPESQGTQVINRLDLPEDLGQVAEVVATRDLMVWNGDEVAKGGGWNWPKDPPTVVPTITNTIVRQGKAALHLHGEGSNGASFGWNWLAWFPGDGGTDLTGMKTLLLSIRVDGAAKPESLRIALNCSSTKKASKEIDLIPRYPGITDGAWHEVAIPLDDMTVGSEFDPKKAWEINVLTGAKVPLNEDIYLDEIGFAR